MDAVLEDKLGMAKMKLRHIRMILSEKDFIEQQELVKQLGWTSPFKDYKDYVKHCKHTEALFA